MEYVHIEFEPWRSVRSAKKSYWLSAEGQEDIQLPMETTTLFTEETPDGKCVVSAEMPKFIAEDRGLLGEQREYSPEPVEAMSRHDWFTLGCDDGDAYSGRRHPRRSVGGVQGGGQTLRERISIA